MAAHTVSIDIETYSDEPITRGVYAYAESPEFEVLLIAYSIDDGPVKLIDLIGADVGEGTDDLEQSTDELLSVLTDPDYIKWAYNANFERTCLRRWFKRPMPPEQWHCSMVLAAEAGYPRSLGAVALALGMPEDEQKDKAGKELIRYFCVPCVETQANGLRTRNLPVHAPDKWTHFRDYCRQDVVTEMAIRRKMAYCTVPDSEWSLWDIDQRINDRGVMIDRDMAESIQRYHDITYKDALICEARELTGIANPNSVPALKRWLKERTGEDVTSVSKDVVPGLIEKYGHLPDVARVLEIRAELAKSSTAKYKAMTDSVCGDGRIRGTFRFYGGRTGRFASKIVQLQNLPQNKIEDIGLARELVRSGRYDDVQMLYDEGLPFILSQLVRTVFIPKPGCTFVVADFSAIEARVLAWLAGERWRMKVFEDGGDIYCASAEQMFHVPVIKHGINGHLRQKGKVAELALGYGGAAGAIRSMDKAGTIPEDEIDGIVERWRNASPMIVRFWRKLERACMLVIERQADNPVVVPGVSVSKSDSTLWISLPSGRRLAYTYPGIGTNRFGKPSLRYKGIDELKRWSYVETFGGKLVENVTQAVARDCLAETMKAVEAAGYEIVMHIHDEVVVEVPDDGKGNTKDLETITSIMGRAIPWAPGLVLRGDGYVTPFYRKD